MKPSRLALLALAAFAVPITAQAQEIDGLAVAPGSTLLTLTAEGKSSRRPDLAVFSAGVATTGKSAREALGANAAAMNRVIRALKAAGIAEKDIQTSNLNLNPVYGSRQRASSTLEEQAPPIIGYRASNNVTVKQRKLDEFGKVIDTLISAGANQVNGPSFQMDEPDEALDEARREAVAKARQRAQLYAGAARLTVKRIVSISESSSNSGGPPMMYARAMAMDVAESTPVSAGEVEMQASVTVTFELAP
ncbi:MAG: SIMPL domain-containing protein [Novosphingobium sp.]|nr:SIMPL domain-containing protein [Novosphingobium sp.]